MKKYSVLTFIMNNYETLREPLEVSDDCEYIVVTDDPNLKSTNWTVKLIPEHLKNADGFTKSFYVRYHPFEFVSTDVCVVLDGSLQIQKKLDKVICDFINSGADTCLSVHWNMINARNEYTYWVSCRGYPKSQAQKCIRFMDMIGYRPNIKGCFETTFKICKRNNVNDSINEYVYRALELLGDKNHVDRVDQSIFSAIVTTHFTDIKVFPITRSFYQGEYVKCFEHHSSTPLKVNIRQQTFYLFDKPCVLYA